MGSFKKILIFPIILIFCAGCVRKAPLSDEQKIYQGEWISRSGDVLIVDYAGTGYLEYEDNGVSVTVKYGKVTIADGQLSISFMGIGKKFTTIRPSETGDAGR
jgi:hypothetical protein